jgi:hypothetical protein
LKEIDGYLPYIKWFCDSDGVNMKLCMECGRIQGFDSKTLKKQFLKEYKDELLGKEDGEQQAEPKIQYPMFSKKPKLSEKKKTTIRTKTAKVKKQKTASVKPKFITAKIINNK